MEWREFIRGLFGLPQQGPSRGNNQQWPPPPPIQIPEFNEELPQDEQTGRRGGISRSEGHLEFPPGRGEFDQEFVFGHVANMMGEMFKEMESSMRDLDSFFGNIRILDDHPAIQDVPSEGCGREVNDRRGKDISIRDSVLKEPKKPEIRERRNYIAQPQCKEDKVDRDLDELYKNSQLDLSDLPLPDVGTSNEQILSPVDLPAQGGFSSSFQRTYQTFSFRNGRWEGEIVKEDPNGKSVTRYYQDENGEKHESTEFYPLGDSNQKSLTDSSVVPPESTRLFQLFDRFFRPRI